jgi:hypothetical protein
MPAKSLQNLEKKGAVRLSSLLWSLRRVSSRQLYVFNEISHLVTFKLWPRQSFSLR